MKEIKRTVNLNLGKLALGSTTNIITKINWEHGKWACFSYYWQRLDEFEVEA